MENGNVQFESRYAREHLWATKAGPGPEKLCHQAAAQDPPVRGSGPWSSIG